MVFKAATAVFIIILVLFFLSVFAPMQSERKFWLGIHKIRKGMDWCSYWFINLCAIVSVLYLLWNVLRGLGLNLIPA